ncbi:MAG: glycosyltransferase family protein [Verrucomicrobiota bacterium]
MKTIAIIQARMGATRLPGKVLLSLCGQTVLSHVIARVRQAKRLHGVLVATTIAPQDEAIERACQQIGVPCHRGSEQDVLDRYYQAARSIDAEVVVRITADCPLFDGELLDHMLGHFEAAREAGVRLDYLCNVVKRTYPRGLDTEIFTMNALERAHREAIKPYEREHVTPYLYQHPELFKRFDFEGDQNWSHYRWTLDTPEDWTLIETIYQHLYRPGKVFATEQVLELLQHQPELVKINAAIEQKKLGQ